VRRGEKGTHVEFWQFPDRAAKPDGDSKEDPGKAERESFVYRAYTVFNAKQIEGIPAHTLRVRPEWEVLESAESILRHAGARLIHDQNDRAFYNRLSDSIHLPPRAAFESQGLFYGTVLHELCHWSGTPERLNRTTLVESYRFGDLNYAKEELRAELASVFLMAERGIPHDPGHHAAYLNSWVEVLLNDKHEIFRAARDAHKAADLLLHLELHQSLDKALAEVNKTAAAKDLPPEPELKSTAELVMNARSAVQLER
jgi:antirestriction protein ArdC